MAYALRCDPDVILNGEIRDLESAFTALKAAMTWHLDDTAPPMMA
ncbi:ATPase, T2SS/T4P/T4SS family [Candidatus Williamhamiltonella defendens]|nr:ATPase, T2SS/T4P/T4SS family [Candidatus Hamiltonella defensa]